MGMKKSCTCGYWSEAQQECLYSGSACICDDERKKPKMTVARTRYWADILSKNQRDFRFFVEEIVKELGGEIIKE